MPPPALSIATRKRTPSNCETDLESAPKTLDRLVIVGGGMAGFGLCDRLVRKNALDKFQVTIIGEESRPAYDRVNLSQLVGQRSEDDLLLARHDWYRDHGIELNTHRRIVKIDPARRCVVDENGVQTDYDQLILATGSRPFVPPIAGADLPGVFVYRTIEDLQAIQAKCSEVGVRVGAVLGGGLLGLEAARILMDLGLRVSVLEMAPGLMPRQLDAEAAKLLRQKVEAMGVQVHLVRRTESIQRTDGEAGTAEKLRIIFSNADDLIVDVLVIASGVRPNDSLAKDTGLAMGPRGGIAVDSSLRTSDPNIYAIGECASFDGHVYGLAAPCFRMADVLAQRLCGGSEPFIRADESAELKLLGIQVATLGREIGESPGGRVVTHHHELGYRKLLVERGRVVGASCVGDWAELPQIRQAISKQSRLWPWQIRRFIHTGSPWSPGGALPVSQWPGDAIVCSCLSVPKSVISTCVAGGATDADMVAAQCGASTACGSCRPLVQELAGDPVLAGQASQSSVAALVSVMGIASVLAIVWSIVWVAAPPIPMATSVQSAWRQVDILWRSDFAKQCTGYSLLAVTIVSQVFSVRKRFDWFTFGSYRFWRTLHGVLGSLLLLGVMVHTGLRLGQNLNLILGTFFLSAGFAGALVGIASSVESRLQGHAALWVRRWRPRLAKLHLWITWPLPALIGLHILSFYWFID